MKTLRFGAKSKNGKARTVLCPECGEVISVAVKALSVACPHCSRRVILEDYRVKGYHGSRDFATAGNIVVERSGNADVHLLLADLAMKEEGFGQLLPGADAIVVDEAHHFPDVAQSLFTTGLGSGQASDRP